MSKPAPTTLTTTGRQRIAYASLQTAAIRFRELQPVAKMLDTVSVDGSLWNDYGGVASLLDRNIREVKRVVDSVADELGSLFQRSGKDEAEQGGTGRQRLAYASLQTAANRFEELEGVAAMLTTVSVNEDLWDEYDGITALLYRNIWEVNSILDDVQDGLDNLFRRVSNAEGGKS